MRNAKAILAALAAAAVMLCLLYVLVFLPVLLEVTQ